MHFDKKELTLIYNSSRELDKKTLAMAHTLGVNINRQDVTSVKISETLFMMFIDKLQMEPKELVDKSYPFYQSDLKGRDFTKDEWYGIILKHPLLLRGPLAMLGEKAVFCQAPNDILRVN